MLMLVRVRHFPLLHSSHALAAATPDHDPIPSAGVSITCFRSRKHSVPSHSVSPVPLYPGKVSSFHNTAQNLFIESTPPLILHAIYLSCLAANTPRKQRNGKKIPESTLLSHILHIPCKPVKVQEHRADVNLPKELLNHHLSYF